jgi:hypothetical protein
MVGWVLAAHAGEPLVYTGDEAAARARVSAATRLAAPDFDAVAAAALRTGPASVGSGGSLTPCGGPAITREQLLLAVEGAEGALTYGEADRARTELSRVSDADRCATWDAQLLSRYFVLRGLVDEDGAASFARARRLQPELAWSEDWPAERRPAFDGAAPEPAVLLQIVPEGYALDGAQVTGKVQVIPGWHRLTGPGFDGALELEADGTFLVPAEVPVAAFDSLDTEDQRFMPSKLLASRFGDGARVFVANDRGVWAATAGRVDWLNLQQQRKHPLLWAGLATALTGVAATAGTSVWMAGAHADAKPLVEQLEGADATTLSTQLPGARDAVARYNTARAVTFVSGGVGAVGLGLFGVGLALGPQTVSGGTP